MIVPLDPLLYVLPLALIVWVGARFRERYIVWKIRRENEASRRARCGS